MKQSKYILPLLLTIITFAIYSPIQTQASTTLYSYSYIDNKDGVDSNSDYVSTSLIILQNDKTIILNNQNWHYIYGYNSSGQILQTTGQGYYNTTNTNTNPTNSSRFSPSNSNLTLTFQNDVHSIYIVALKGSRPWTNSPISLTNFQTLTVSYNNPTPTPTLTTVVSQISPFSALVEAQISDAPANITDRGVVVGTSANPTLTNNRHIVNTNLYIVGNFFSAAIGTGSDSANQLDPSTTYHVRSYITYDGTTVYGPNVQFTTEQQTHHIVPTPTYSINPNLAATITFPAITEGNEWQTTIRGWLWTNDGTTPTLENTLSQSPWGNPSNNNLYEIFPVLDYSTTYKYRQYVRNSNSSNSPITYSDVLTFTTPNQTFEVEFRDYDGTLIATRTVEQGEAVTDLPPNPTRDGFTFTAWEPPVTNIQGNLVTFAQYTINTYLVTFIADGLLIGQQNIAHGSTLNTIPIPTKEGFTFINYTLDGNVFNISTDVITAPLELIAVFSEIPTFTITWRDPAFNVLKIETVNSGLTGTPSNYVPNSGFTLVGWTPDITQPVIQNIQYIAIVQEVTTNSGTTPIVIQNATGLTDLFSAVFGAIVGSLMILGTIDLFGLQLSSLFWLFFAGTGFMMIWKVIRG